MIDFIFKNPFILNALIGAFLASIASGLMGSYVSAKKISSISGSIAHSILGGIGIVIFIKYKYNLSFLLPMYGAIIFAILSASLIGYIHVNHKQKEDAAIATIWSSGMAIGIIFISFLPSFNADFTHFLFGNILLVSKTDLYFLFFLDIILIFFVIIYYFRFLAICFNEELAFTQDINVNKNYLFLLCLISISIVALIQIIGILLVITMLTIPPSISRYFTNKMYKVMLLSFILSFFFSLLGIFISYHINIPPGATIALLTSIFYLIFIKYKNKKKFYTYKKNI